MKKTQDKKKTSIPSKKDIEKMFVAINKFQKNNVRFLLSAKNNIPEKSASAHIITTNNTNI